jgi:hypothetical protein
MRQKIDDIKHRIKINVEILYFRLLKKSGVFSYWRVQDLSQLLFELEMFDITGHRTIRRYQKELRRAKKGYKKRKYRRKGASLKTKIDDFIYRLRLWYGRGE